MAEAETLLAEVAPANVATSSSAKSTTCGHLLLAFRTASTEITDGTSNVSTQQRLLGRLERWIDAQLARRDELEAKLRQRCIDMEIELAKSSSEVSVFLPAARSKWTS